MKRHLIKFLFALFLISSGPFSTFAQGSKPDPAVNGATVTPSPQTFPAADPNNPGVAGFFFHLTNDGKTINNDPRVRLTVSITGMELSPTFDIQTDITATGEAANFTWNYDPSTHTFTGTLAGAFPFAGGGIVTVKNLVVSAASAFANPTNGINVNITTPSAINADQSAGSDNTNSFTYTVAPVNISGNVWDDKDGNAVNNGEGNIGSGVWVNLVNPVTHNVIQSVEVDASGNYSFNGTPNASYNIILTSSQQTYGATLTASSLPANYVNTGVNLGGTAITSNQNGSITINTGNAGLSNQNFGIEQLPNSDNVNVVITKKVYLGDNFILDNRDYTVGQNNNTAIVNFPPLAGTDPEDGTLGAGNSVRIITVPGNATLFYNGNQVAAGELIPNYNPSNLSITLTQPGSNTIQFTFAFIDAADKEDPTPATYTIDYPFVLPVQLISFTAKGDNGDAVLDWSTSTEQNNAGFSVEHSSDGNTWNTLGFVKSKSVNGNSNQKLSYQYMDKGITNGTHYYRLKQTDLNGAYGYSDIANVNNSSMNAAFRVYPNPSASYIFIEYTGAAKTPIKVMDMNGRVVKSLYSTGTKTRLLTNDLSAGTYVISIDGKTTKITVAR